MNDDQQTKPVKYELVSITVGEVTPEMKRKRMSSPMTVVLREVVEGSITIDVTVTE